MEPHLQKIKLLLNLAQSPEPHEAANATAKAQELIEKYSVSPEQLEALTNSDKPLYGDDNLFLEIKEPADWIRILALAVARKYDCYAIQEQNTIATGEIYYRYFVYGADEDVAIAKQLFNYLHQEITKLVEDQCEGENDLFRESYTEGAVSGVKRNIEYETFNVSGMVKSKSVEAPTSEEAALAPVMKSAIKPPPIENKSNVSNQEKPIDIWAYWEGEGAGAEIHLDNSPGPFKKIISHVMKMFDNAHEEDY